MDQFETLLPSIKEEKFSNKADMSVLKGSVVQIQSELELLRGEADALRIGNDDLEKRNFTLEGDVKLLMEGMLHLRRDACAKNVIVHKLRDSESLNKDLAASV